MKILLRGSLDHSAFEEIIHSLDRVESGTEVIFDGSGVSFVDPYGLVGLITAARYCKGLGIRPKIVAPPLSVSTYMKRMNFFEAMDEYGDYEKVFSFSFPSRRDSPLLEVTKVEVSQGYNSIIDISGELTKRMKMMLSRGSTFSQSTVTGLVTNIVEICENVEHSHDIGFVAAQRYRTTIPMVKVGIMDLGIGIANSLRGKYERKVSNWSDSKAIRLSLLPDITSRQESGGLGLSQLSKFIREQTRGELVIRSGNAKRVISHEGERDYRELNFFPGTQISMTIPAC